MVCLLKKDPAEVFCALGAMAAHPIVFIKGPDTARITSAMFNGAHVTVSPDDTIELPALKAGTNRLNLTVEGVNEGDDVTLMEKCLNASDGELCTRTVGA